MRRVFLDTNIVLDFLLSREPWADQAQPLWDAVADQTIEAVISASTPLIVFYVARKLLPTSELREILRDLLTLVEIAPIDLAALRAGLNSNMGDYEDAVSAACAVAGKSELIVTRDLKDFKEALLPALSPTDFVARYLPPSP